MNGLYGPAADKAFLLFFVNGLAFFAMGLAVALELQKTSLFAIGQSLKLLASYGFVACLANWTQMLYIGLSGTTPETGSILLRTLSLLFFILTATLLLAFGVRLMISHETRYRWLRAGFWVLPALYVGILLVALPATHDRGGDWISAAETAARYLLYFPALILSGIGVLVQRRGLLRARLVAPARDALCAAFAFGLKAALSGLIAVPILGLLAFSASLWVMSLQLLRTLTTVAIAFFVVRILRAFEANRRRQLDAAIQDRLRAKEEALAIQQQACDEIERWSDSMADMVHTVSSAISQPVSLKETMHVVLLETIRLSGLESGAVFLVDEEKSVLRLVAHEAFPPWVAIHLAEVRIGEGLAGRVAQEGAMLIVDDALQQPQAPGSQDGEDLMFHVGVPLKARGKVVGVMNVCSVECHHLSGQQVALLVAVGQQLGVAIENSRLYERIRYMATTEERSRLAREIHDNLSQLLGYLNLKAASAEQLLARDQVEQARDALREVKQIAQEVYADARETIFSLRATTSEEGLLVALQGYLADYAMYYGLQAELIVNDPLLLEFPAETEIQISCIIQEALTNVRKHAGARKVWLRFEPQGSMVRLCIQDDGRGFDPGWSDDKGGLRFGLSIMRERAESVGGRLELDSQLGAGTQVVVWVPRARRV